MTETTPQGQSTEVKTEPGNVAVTEANEPTTSQQLFKHMAGRNVPGLKEMFPGAYEKKSDPVKTPEKKDAAAKTDEPKPEAKKEEKKYLDSEALKSSILKLKVDGVEEEASFEDVIRRVQTDSHLTKKGQRLSDEEKKIKDRERVLEERERLVIEMLAQPKTKPEANDDAESIVKDDPYVKRLEADFKKMQETLNALSVQAQPMLLKAAIERAANRAKETMGLDDFPAYQEKIREHLLSLPSEQARANDNEDGWLSIYKDIKIRELIKKSTEQAARPESKPADRVVPAPVPIESGKSVVSENDDIASKLRNLKARAERLTQENSRDKDRAWADYLDFLEKTREPAQ